MTVRPVTFLITMAIMTTCLKAYANQSAPPAALNYSKLAISPGVFCFANRPVHSDLALGVMGGNVDIINIQTGLLKFVGISSHSVKSVSESPDGKYVAACSMTGISAWNIHTGRRLATNFISNDRFCCLTFVGSSDALAISAYNITPAGKYESSIALWDLSARKVIWRKPIPGIAESIDASDTGAMIAAACSGPAIITFRAKDGFEKSANLPKADSIGFLVSFAPGGKTLAVVTTGGNCYVLPTALTTIVLSLHPSGSIVSLSFCEHGGDIAIGLAESHQIIFVGSLSGMKHGAYHLPDYAPGNVAYGLTYSVVNDELIINDGYTSILLIPSIGKSLFSDGGNVLLSNLRQNDSS